VIIRDAIHTDAPAIAHVHVDTWRATYRGIMPDDYLDNLSYDTRAAFWARLISDPFTPSFVHVAEDDSGGIVGFVSGGPPQSDVSGYDGELYAIYVLPEAQGKGIGRKLVQACAQTLKERGITSMLLWVLKDNAPSRAFYESLGGQTLNEQQFELGGSTLTEVGYGWPDTDSLLTR
jgi:ribosomal protein S18 acetylase RimI-like enzyme